MKKKALAVLMTAAMVATLAGCGEAADNTGNSTPANNGGAAGSEANNGGAAGSEVKDVTLKVWSPSEDQDEGSGAWLQTMCEQFNDAHPEWNITFEYGVCAEGDAKATVTQDVDAAADVYMFANDNLTDLIAAGAIAELGGSTLSYIQENIPTSMVNSVTVDGAVYGIPFTSNTWFMYYNKNIFSEDDVKNLDNMLAKAKVAFPLTNSWYIASFYVANGCTLFGDGTDEAAGIDFSGDKAVAVTDYLIDMVANANFVNDADGAGMSGLKDGSIGAIFSGTWDYSNVCDAIGEENVGACQLPTITLGGAEKQLKAYAGSKAIGVNAHCANPEVAVALAAYLGGEEAQAAHFNLRNIIPTNNTVAATADVQANVIAKAQADCINNTSIMQPFVGAMGNYWGNAENMGKAIVAGTVTHDNAAAETENMNTAMNTSAVE